MSDFRITPVVAIAERRPVLTPSPDEVARVLEPPVAAFLPDAPIEVVERTIRDWPLRYGGYRIDGLHVWGATARILGQLGAVLDGAGTTPRRRSRPNPSRARPRGSWHPSDSARSARLPSTLTTGAPMAGRAVPR